MSHQCPYLREISQGPGFSVQVLASEEGSFLEYRSFSTDEDVQAGECAAAGEPVGSVSLRIFFCPFCGVALPTSKRGGH